MILQLLRSNVLFLWRHENIVHTVLYIFPGIPIGKIDMLYGVGRTTAIDSLEAPI